MSEVVPIRPVEEGPPAAQPRALAQILLSEPEVAAWLACDEDGDDEPPRAA